MTDRAVETNRVGFAVFVNPLGASADAVYHELGALAEAAEALGPYQTLWVTERHAGSPVPDPLLLSGLVAASTTTIGFGPLATLLGCHHPVRVAEQAAMAERLLGCGRLQLGVAAGFLPGDFALFSTPPSEARQRFTEGVEVLTLALSGRRFSYRGAQYCFEDAQLGLTPLSRPFPLWVACSSSAASFELAGRLGLHVAVNPWGSSDLAGGIACYRRARALHGHDPAAGRVVATVHAFVGSRREAEDRAWPALGRYLATAARIEGRPSVPERARLAPFMLFGPPPDLVDKIRALVDLGVTDVAVAPLFGELGLYTALGTLAAVAEEVVPAVGTPAPLVPALGTSRGGRA